MNSVIYSCTWSGVQSLPIKANVGQSSFVVNLSWNCCRPSIDAKACFDGTSSMTLGNCLLIYADGKDIRFVPSIDETTKPSIRVQGSRFEVPCIVVVNKWAVLTSALGIFNNDVMYGSTIVTLD